jgi:hypothetical protein
MDNLDSYEVMNGGGISKESLMSYMFSLSTTEKNELINLLQYILLAIIPVVILLKLMKTYMPPENNKKASVEILIEVILQFSLIFLVFWFIHKIILFIPTYSASPYPKINIIQIVIPVIFLLVSMKTSLSEKLSILLDRSMVMIGLTKENMEDEEDDQKKKKQLGSILNPPTNFLPNPQNTSMETNQSQTPQFQQMYNSPQPQSIPQGQFGMNEPMASNDMIGGGGYMLY